MDDIKVIYEDGDILAVNKPAGLLVHEAPKVNTKSKRQNPKQILNPKSKILNQLTLVDWLVEKYPEIKEVGDDGINSEEAPRLPSTKLGINRSGQVSNSNLRPGIVHRLDKDTSGILLVAKNQKAFDFLKEQFQERKVQKTYLVLVKSNLKVPAYSASRPEEKDFGVIDKPIGKSRSDFRKKTTHSNARGKIREAVTEYKVIKYYPKENYTLVEAFPKTGRTHQLRVHFSSVGNPVVCDKLYGLSRKTGQAKKECPLGLTRQFLHAQAIEFTAPSGASLKLEAPLPDDLKKALTLLE
jgi:23S rRNA pseudouridine1911/1915/1917 synthase